MSDRRAYGHFDLDQDVRVSAEPIRKDLPAPDEDPLMVREGNDRIGEKWMRSPARYRRPSKPLKD